MSVNRQVLDFSTDSSSSDDDIVKDIVVKLKKQGRLSVETVGQILNAVSDNQNNQSTNAEQPKVSVFIYKQIFLLLFLWRCTWDQARKLIWDLIILLVQKRFVVWFVCRSSFSCCSG